jgi:hypothetical protein
MVRIWLLLLALSTSVQADERTQRLALRLAEEASAFQRAATRVLGVETLEQRAQKPPKRFRIRVGDNAKRTPEIEWQQRKIVSEYAFATFGSEGTIHELRQVTSVDGKPVKNQGPEALARLILANDVDRKRELLEQFANYGLLGAVTDFGQVILLFSPANIGRYEFGFLRDARQGDQRIVVFSYKQIDGPSPVTVIDSRSKAATSLSAAGEVWVNADTYAPVRITLRSGDNTVVQEASIEYAMSGSGIVLPVRTDHRESRNGQVTAENHFTYSGFRRFGASADIIFEAEDPQ